MNDRDEAEVALYQSDRKAYNLEPIGHKDEEAAQQEIEYVNNQFRETCDRQFEALLDRTFGRQTQEDFEADLETVRTALEEATTEEMIEPGSREQIREERMTRVVLGFDDLTAESRLDAIILCLDTLYEQARAGNVDKCAAEQIIFRAELIIAAVSLPDLRGAA